MKHLDQLLDELQHPVDIVQAWCDADKDRAVAAVLRDLLEEKSYRFFEVLSEAYYDQTAAELGELTGSICEEILLAESEDEYPDINYDKLYQPVESIINDRIDFYNRS